MQTQGGYSSSSSGYSNSYPFGQAHGFARTGSQVRLRTVAAPIPAKVPAPPTKSERIDAAAKILLSVAQLTHVQKGWDGDNAPKPSDSALINGLLVLASRPSVDAITTADKLEVGPACDGGVDMTIEIGDRWLSVLTHNDGRIEIERSDGTEHETTDAKTAHAHFAWLTSRR